MSSGTSSSESLLSSESGSESSECSGPPNRMRSRSCVAEPACTVEPGCAAGAASATAGAGADARELCRVDVRVRRGATGPDELAAAEEELRVDVVRGLRTAPAGGSTARAGEFKFESGRDSVSEIVRRRSRIVDSTRLRSVRCLSRVSSNRCAIQRHPK